MKANSPHTWLQQLRKYFENSSDVEIQHCLDFLEQKIPKDMAAAAVVEIDEKMLVPSQVVEVPLELMQKKMNLPLPTEFDTTQFDLLLCSDGGCQGNPGPGGWGTIGQNVQGEMIFEICGYHPHTTNNRMELEGGIRGLMQLLERNEQDQHILFLSDSQYFVKGMNEWLSGWKKRNWRKSDNSVVLNQDCWQKLDELRSRFHHLKFAWVRGHNGHPQNERCDALINALLREREREKGNL